MAKAKIAIGGIASVLSVSQKIENAGFSIGRNEAGLACLTVKFPGVEALELGKADLDSIAARLTAPVVEGSTPAQVFARSGADNADGGMSARFSDAERSRSVSFTASDRVEVAALLTKHAEAFSDYEKMLTDAEAENAGDDNSGDDS